jgi:hypothetical protein
VAGSASQPERRAPYQVALANAWALGIVTAAVAAACRSALGGSVVPLLLAAVGMPVLLGRDAGGSRAGWLVCAGPPAPAGLGSAALAMGRSRRRVRGSGPTVLG